MLGWMDVHRVAVWHKEMVMSVVKWEVSHSHVVDKNQEGYPGSERSRHQPRWQRTWEINFHNFFCENFPQQIHWGFG